MEDTISAREHLTELQTRIEQLAPRCDWSNSGIVPIEVDDARIRYRDLMRRALKIELELGY